MKSIILDDKNILTFTRIFKTNRNMKKSLLLLLFACLTIFPSYSQGFGQGDKMLQIGISLSNYNRYGWANQSSFFIPLYASFEVGIHKWVSIGGLAHFHTRRLRGNRYRGNFYYSAYEKQETWFSVGVKSSFLFTPFLNEVANTALPEEFHLLAGVNAGLDYYGTTETAFNYSDSWGNAGFFVGPWIGARYMFTEGFGVFAETGFGWIGHGSDSGYPHFHGGTLGAAFKF